MKQLTMDFSHPLDRSDAETYFAAYKQRMEAMNEIGRTLPFELAVAKSDWRGDSFENVMRHRQLEKRVRIHARIFLRFMMDYPKGRS